MQDQNVAVYMRTSSKKTKSAKASLANQRRKIVEAVLSEVTQPSAGVTFWEYEDSPLGNAARRCPGMPHLIDHVTTGLYQRVVVSDLSRISDLPTEVSSFLALLEAYDVAFQSLAEGIDTRDIVGRSMVALHRMMTGENMNPITIR